jgi:5-methylcytosine-specific restriction endonuclease McrA
MSACHYCGNPGAKTRDHIVPKALGGLDRTWNIVRACVRCNGRKANHWPTCPCDTCQNSVRLHRALLGLSA